MKKSPGVATSRNSRSFEMSAPSRPLAGIDWNFPAANSTYGVHGLHWYPASFIPQIPAYLIELFSRPGDLVLDPFAGSGASLVEALRLGRRTFGLDLNPIAVLIARAKLLLLTDWPWESAAEALINQLESDRLITELVVDGIGRDSVDLPTGLAEARRWYHPTTFKHLCLILRRIEDTPEPAQTVFRAAFSSILKRASGQREHWGYVADNMVPAAAEPHDAFAMYARALRTAVRARAEMFGGTAGRLTMEALEQSARVIQGDVLGDLVPLEGTVDLVITSPPYVGVTDYTTAQRLSMYWFEHDLDALKRQEIGARWKRFRRSYTQDYMDDMRAAFNRVAATLRPGGYLALVIGVPNAREAAYSILSSLRALLVEFDLQLIDETVRMPARQRLVDRAGTTNPESILVYRKPG